MTVARLAVTSTAGLVPMFCSVSCMVTVSPGSGIPSPSPPQNRQSIGTTTGPTTGMKQMLSPGLTTGSRQAN